MHRLVSAQSRPEKAVKGDNGKTEHRHDESARHVELSATAPISFGRIAPPMIAMTMNADAFFARAPRPKMPSAKIVGNMIDMKK